MDATVAKFELDGDLRRARIAGATLAALQAAAREVFGANAAAELELKYQDDEGDHCTLTPDTFPDFLALNADRSVLRLKVVRRAPEPPQAPASASPCAAAKDEAAQAAAETSRPEAPAEAPWWAPRSWSSHWPPHHHHHHGHWHHHRGHHGNRHAHGGGQPSHCPWQPQHILQHLAGMCAGGFPARAGNASIAVMLVHFGPLILPHLQSRHAEVDRWIAARNEALAPVIEALREGLEPFPQFQETQTALDRMLQSDTSEGAGEAFCSILRTLASLPQDQRCDTAEAIFGGVAEQLPQVIPALLARECASTPAEAEVHEWVRCDGCGAFPIGDRWKCQACPDFDLCSACYSRKDDLPHDPSHEFSLAVARRTADFEKGKGKGRHGGDGWGNGWGMHCGWPWAKGKGKGKRCWATSSSSTSDSSDSSPSDSSVEEVRTSAVGEAQHRESHALAVRQAARRHMKAQIQEAKRAYREERQHRKRQRRDGSTRRGATACEGHAVEKSAQPGASTPEQPEASALQVLSDMGFNNPALLSELLGHHGGNVQKVIEELLGPLCDKSPRDSNMT